MRRKIAKALMIISALLLTQHVTAQKTEVGNWFIYFGNKQLSKKWNWWHEVQYRNYNFAGDLQQLLLRTGIGYNLSEDNNNILLGYGFVNSKAYISGTDDKQGVNEHRIYQQFITRQNFGRVYLQHRYRVEERILPDDFQLRFRYFLSVNIPVNSKTMTKGALYVSSYNEVFLNAQNAIFDRNRLYGALGYVFNKNLRAEVGFMAQTVQGANRNQTQIVFFNNLPCKGKQAD